MGKAKKFIESDDEEIPADDSEDYEEEDEDDDEEERIPIQRQPMKVTARPRRAAAAAVSKLTQKLKDDEDEAEDEDEDEFPEIPKPVLTKYKAEINAEAGTVLVIPKAEVNPAMLKALLADEWPIWSAKTGGWPNLNHEYEYVYPLKELSLVTEGSATITPTGGKAVEITKGDYAVFPKGLECVWVITQPFKKKYFEFK